MPREKKAGGSGKEIESKSEVKKDSELFRI
jgi:hypothetical protein